MIQLTTHGDAVHIPLWVQPGAKADRIVGEHNNCLKIAVTAPPEGGRANKAVVRLLSKHLQTKKSAVTILSGATSRRKSVAVAGVPFQQVVDLCRKMSASKKE